MNELEQLKLQLAEKDKEIEQLKSENRDACMGLNDYYFGQQLAASQAREVQLREALEDANDFVERHSNRWDGINGKHPCTVVESSRQALALPQDTTALSAMIAKAGEVMRGQCVDVIGPYGKTRYLSSYEEGCEDTKAGIDTEIRALPGVTLEDLK